MGERGTSCIYH